MKRLFAIVVFSILATLSVYGQDNYTEYLCFTAEEAGSTFSIPNENIEYSTDGNNWTNLTETYTFENQGDKVYLKCEKWSPGKSFTMTGSIAASGNIMSLRLDNGAISNTRQLSKECFSKLFYNCTALTSAPDLPATTLNQNCYFFMFYGCTRLTQAPELPATTLATMCYDNMFQDCTGLTQAPKLPATTLASGCYSGMFQGCKNLTQAPELPATTLAGSCYTSMFKNCTGLTEAPKLPATILASQCYSDMFYGCTELTEAPDLPATTLATQCYQNMFYGCTGLIQAPELPATSLAYNCYQNMFNGCNGLTQAPELPATTLEGKCYYQMFYECRNIQEIKVNFADWGDASLEATARWLYNTGEDAYRLNNKQLIFNCPIELDVTGNSHIPSQWKIIPQNCLNLSTNEENGASFSIKSQDKSLPFPEIKYSTNGRDWQVIEEDAKIRITITDPVFLKGENSSIYPAQFVMEDGEIMANDNIMSIVDNQATIIPSNNCFKNLFKDCRSLVSAPDSILAAQLTNGCYYGMFEGTQITKAPVLPATYLAENCYTNMFKDCKKLKFVKAAFSDWKEDYNATTNWLSNVSPKGIFIFSNEFPQEIPIDGSHIPEGWINNSDYLRLTSTANNSSFALQKEGDFDCPEMEYSTDGEHWETLSIGDRITMATGNNYYIRAANYQNSSLSLDRNNYLHFSMDGNIKASGKVMSLLGDGNINSNTVPQYSFHKLFSNCAALTTAPLLPAEKLSKGCYNEMFSGCSSLSDITVGFTNWNNGESTQDWLKGVAESGTFNRNGLPTRKGDSYIPESWLPKLNIEQSEEFDDEEGFCGAEIIIPLKFSNGNRPRYYSTDNETFYEFKGDDLTTGDVVFKIDINSVKPGNREYNVVFKDDIEDPDVLGSITIRAKLNLPKEYIEKMYNDIVYVNNGEHIFVDYTWHDNSGKVLSNKQMYQDKNLPKNGGKYSVDVTTTEGFRLKICPQEFSPSSIAKSTQITAMPYPNPARAGEEFGIDISGADDCQNIKVYIYNSLGNIIRTIEGAANTIRTSLPAGIYTGSAVSDKSNTQFKLIVK